MSNKQLKFNQTVLYILPLLFPTIKLKDIRTLLGCYLGLNSLPELQGFILLHLDMSDDSLDIEFEDRLKIHPKYAFSNEYKDSMVYGFNPSEEDRKVIEYIMNSSPSKLPEDYKKHVLYFHDLNDKSKPAGAMYKADWYRTAREEEIGCSLPIDCELGEAFNMNKNIL